MSSPHPEGGLPGRASRSISPFEWLYLALGVVSVVRYRWIFDDSFVYFRYVDNALFTGAGLTANAGEFVEGFSSPFHLLALLGLRSLGLGYPLINVGLGCSAFVAFWLLACRLNRALTPAPLRGAPAVDAPLLFLAGCYSVTSFFTAGNEGPWLHLAAVVTGLYVCRPSSRGLAIAAAFLPLVRPELVLGLAIAGAWAWAGTRVFPRTLVVASLLVNCAWLAFRVVYYADLLPNTFYLKTGTEPIEGSSLGAGLAYLLDATTPYATLFVLAVLLGTLVLVAARGGGGRGLALGPRSAMLSIAAAVGGWVVATGGSAMHYYYLAFPLTLALLACGGVAEIAAARTGLRRRPAVLAAVVVALFALILSRYPGSLSRHPITRGERMETLPSRTVMTDPSFFRHREALPDQWPTIAELRAFSPKLASDGYESVTDIAWCNAVYANYDVRSVHAFGLTDAILARVEAPEIKRGHKPALEALAHDLIELQLAGGFVGPGVYTGAIEEGRAPEWMARNAGTIRIIERKIFNRHDLAENLRLSLAFPPKIEP